MLARSPREWEECLETLITDHGLRRRIAAGGLETVRRHFSLERCFQGLRYALTGAPARDRSES